MITANYFQLLAAIGGIGMLGKSKKADVPEFVALLVDAVSALGLKPKDVQSKMKAAITKVLEREILSTPNLEAAVHHMGEIQNECLSPEELYEYMTSEEPVILFSVNLENAVFRYINKDVATEQIDFQMLAVRLLDGIDAEINADTDLLHCKEACKIDRLLSMIYSMDLKLDRLIERVEQNGQRNMVVSVKEVTRTVPIRPSVFFRGRQPILSKIQIALQQSRNLLVLSGMGGIGKTEICRHLYYQYLYEDREIPYIGWLFFKNSLKETVYNQFKEVEGENIDDYYEHVKVYLDGIKNQLLLFVDNVNELSFQDQAELRRLPCKIVLTSKQPYKFAESIPIERLSFQDCRQLYEELCEIDADKNEVLDGIIALADCHTLSVELLAKTQLESGMTTQEFYERLKETGFDLTKLTERIESDYNLEQMNAEDEYYKTFIGHMEKVFCIAEIQGEDLQLLKLLALFPPDGTKRKNILKLLGLSDMDSINNLIRRGWLSEDRNRRIVLMHPIIASAVKSQAPASYQDAQMLLENLLRVLEIDVSNGLVFKSAFFPIAVSVAQGVEADTENYAVLCNTIGRCLFEKGQYWDANDWYQKALKHLDPEHPQKGVIYDNIGNAYRAQGEYVKARQWFELAVSEKEAVPDSIPVDKVVTYANLGNIHMAQGNYKNAEVWLQKALDESKKTGNTDGRIVATLMNDMGVWHYGRQEYEEAMEYYQNSLELNLKYRGDSHTDTGLNYTNMGDLCVKLKEYEKAHGFLTSAIDIYEKNWGDDHPELIEPLCHMAELCIETNKYDEASRHLLRAAAIAEEKLGLEHVNMIGIYMMNERLCLVQGQYKKAMAFRQKSLLISEKMLREGKISFEHFKL